MSQLKDGKYLSLAKGRNGEILVNVTIKNSAISFVNIIRQREDASIGVKLCYS